MFAEHAWNCTPTQEKLPDTFAPTSDERSLRDARKACGRDNNYVYVKQRGRPSHRQALKLLRAALPPLAKGKVEEACLFIT